MSEEDIGRFKWPEYIVFSLVLAISAIIGIYYGCFGKKQKTTTDFLMAGKNMNPVPMSMSLLASFMSAIVMVGTPAEMYQKGTMYWTMSIAFVPAIVVTSYLFMPVFFNLQFTSVYEYLERRFHKYVRRLASIIVILQMTVYMSIVVYAPSLALTQVTGMNEFIIVTLTFVVCIFYTTLGGMKGVIWTDFFQAFTMFSAVISVCIKGLIDVGGFGQVWETAKKHSRLEFFKWDMDPRVRHSTWTVVVGGYFYWLALYGVNQTTVQRYLTVKSINKARQALWINLVGLVALMTVCSFAGLVMFTKFVNCDPLTSKQVSSSDQLMPMFVMEVFDNIPGLAGLFIGGVFSGSLSTVSSGLNSLAAITLEDFVKVYYTNLSDQRATTISKVLAVFFGIVSLGFVFIISQLTGVLQITLSGVGAIGGPLLGIFCLGMFWPYANWKGAFVGGIVGLVMTFWLAIGTSIEIINGNIIHQNLPLSVEGCVNKNFTISPPKFSQNGGIMEIYKISYLWYTGIGTVITIILGLIISFITKPQDPRELNPNMISPPLDKLIRLIFPEFRFKIGWDLGSNLKMIERHSTEISVINDNLSCDKKS